MPSARVGWWWGSMIAFAFAFGCASHGDGLREAPLASPFGSAQRASAPPVPPAAPLPRLSSSDPPLLELPVAGHLAALVSLPSESDAPKPVLLAAGGAGDTPEWQCRAWRAIVEGRGFVVCLRGDAMNPGAPKQDQRYYYKNHFALENEARAALSALEGEYGARVDRGSVLYAGFSQGATMGALFLQRNPRRFTRAILAEGGGYWQEASAKQFQRGGGERILMACGQESTFERARRSKAILERAGILTKVEYAEGAGHTYEGPMALKLRAGFAWITEGDARWGGNR